jgi:3-hydroxybutyryl-CoA dehydrogenase
LTAQALPGDVGRGLLLSAGHESSQRRNVSIERVGVIGAGQMGAGIAEVSARAGVDVLVYEPTEALTTAGRNRIVKSVERGVSAGKITER